MWNSCDVFKVHSLKYSYVEVSYANLIFALPKCFLIMIFRCSKTRFKGQENLRLDSVLEMLIHLLALGWEGGKVEAERQAGSDSTSECLYWYLALCTVCQWGGDICSRLSSICHWRGTLGTGRTQTDKWKRGFGLNAAILNIINGPRFLDL